MQRKVSSKKKPLPSELTEPPPIGKGGYLNYGKPKEAFVISKVPISYRLKEPSPTMGETRRYYIGFVQFAFAQKSDEGWVTYLTNGYEQASLKGVILRTEKDLHAYLEKELLG